MAGPAQATYRNALSLAAHFSLVGVSCLAVLLFKLAFSGRGPRTQMMRVAVTYAVDGATPLIATDECLAAHRLEYLSKRQDKELDVVRLPGYVIDAELNARSRDLDRRVFAPGLHSYRMKVRSGELLDPETLDDAACPGCPGVDQELRDWIADEGHSESSRYLAQFALSGTLYPPEKPQRHRSTPDPDRMLRYPSRSP